MEANSAPIRSSQQAPHARLREIVLRHLGAGWRRKPSAAGRRAFDTIAARLAGTPFVLDAGCGTGVGTFVLAARHRERIVLGVDKSAARLGIGKRLLAAGAAPANALLLRCELVDFWQLAAEAGLRCERQYLLYPNPWPKREHLQRRWHAHPVLPALLALGGGIELRTNWRIYAEEFAQSLCLAGLGAQCAPLAVDAPLTPFERKYAASGHALWCVLASRESETRAAPANAGAA